MTYRDGKVAAEGYLILVPDIYKWSGEPYVRSIRIDRFRASKPNLRKGEITVKVKLWFDKEQLKEHVPVVEMDVHNFTLADPTLEVLTDDVTAISSEAGPVVNVSE